MAKKAMNKIFLFPLSLIVIFFSSLIIIFSPVGNKNIIKIPTSTPTPKVVPTITPTPSPKPISWQTYTNSIDNFQISYPSNWKITQELSEVVNFENPNYAQISISSSNDREITLPIKTWINKYNNKLLNDPNRHPASSLVTILPSDNILNIDITPVIIANDFFISAGVTYIFPHNNKIFEISTSYPWDVNNLSDPDMQKNISEINQILSTFKFLPDTSTWKTYKNSYNTLEFKYPQSWQILRQNDNELVIGSGQFELVDTFFPPLGQAVISFWYGGASGCEGIYVPENINSGGGYYDRFSGAFCIDSYYNIGDSKSSLYEKEIFSILSSILRTYRDSDNGFEFKYPIRYQYKKNFKNISGQNKYSSVIIYESKFDEKKLQDENASYIDTELFILDFSGEFKYNPESMSEIKKLQLGNNIYETFSEKNNQSEDVYYYKIGNILFINKNLNWHKLNPDFDKILSTFKFIK